jgi:hypothetical protein
MKHARAYRSLFLLAGIYNLAWGLVSALRPQWLFELAGMPPANYPQLFACIGMIVGVYGILYLEVARDPRRGFLIAFVGLLGKVLGPLGLAVAIAHGGWPLQSIVLSVTNDFIWWIPFGAYLIHSWPTYRSSLREFHLPD